MRYTLRGDEEIEEKIRSWKLPPQVASHLQRESRSDRLLEEPFEAMRAIDSVANVYRWTVIADDPEVLRLDFKIFVDKESRELRITGAWCIRPLMQVAALQPRFASQPR